MTNLFQDLRFAVRQWRQRPAFTLLVVGTLALGIGANAAIFSVVDSVLLAPLPYRQPERVMMIYSQFPTLGFDKFWVSPPEYLDLRRWADAFQEIGAYRIRASNVSGGEKPVRVTSAVASASLFRALGVEAAYGRTFTAEEDLPGGPSAVLLSQGFWKRSFGGDSALLGKTIRVDGRPATVVGILPAGFDLEDAGVDVWLPLALDPASPGGRGSHYLFLVGRLADGVSLTQARQQMSGLLVRWGKELPDTHVPNPENHPLVIEPIKEALIGQARPAVLLLMGAVALVLLIACANVANLLLARAEARHKEVVVRTALGAGHGRLVRQFLTESVLVSLLGGALGVLVAIWGVNALLAANPGSVVRLEHVSLSLPVLSYAFAIAVLTGIVFGLAPAVHLRRHTFFLSLKEGVRATAGRGARSFRSSLVVAEVALAAVLVVGAGLLLRSFSQLRDVDPGFDPRGILVAQVSLPPAAYPEAHDTEELYRRLLARARSLPGVESAAAMTGLPPKRDVDANDTEFEGVPEPPEGPPQNVDYYQVVTGGYFETMKIPLVAGRPFGREDAAGAPTVVVNQRLAQVFWPGADPIGRRLRPYLGRETPWFTVVGVVGDVKQGGLDRPAGTELYFFADFLSGKLGLPLETMNLVLRTSGDPRQLAAPVRAAVGDLDPTLPIAKLQPLGEIVSSSMSGSRFLTLLLVLFGGLALALATVGTYGVLSYTVEERRHEMGVRMALGARAGSLLTLVLGRGMRLVVLGLGVGMVGAWAMRRAVASVLFEIAPTDPSTYASVAVLLPLVALAACLVPAYRASRVDPVETLRIE